MKKNFSSVVMALVVAASSMAAQSAFAAGADISKAPKAVTLASKGTANFGDTFSNNNQANLFSDKFTFNTSGLSNVDMIVTSTSTKATNGLNLTGLALFNSNTNLVVAGGVQLLTGIQDKWTLSINNLAAGSYYFKVSGNVVSNTGGAFAGNGHVLAVPEADTYAMLLAGFGVLGLMARRRNKAA